MTEETNETAGVAEKRRPGRPPLVRVVEAPTPVPPARPAPPTAPAKPSLRQRTMALLTRTRTGQPLDAEAYRKAAQEREELLDARVEAAHQGRTSYPITTVKNWERELTMIANGTWRPGQKPLSRREAELANDILGGPPMPGISTDPGDHLCDALIGDSGE